MAPSEDPPKRRARKTAALADPTASDLLVLDHLPDVVSRLDAGGRFTFVNRIGLEVTGRTRQDFENKTPRECGLPEEICRLIGEHVRDVLATGQPSSFSSWFDSTSGRRLYHTQAVPDPGPGGIRTVILISRDVTALHQAAELARKSAARFAAFMENLPVSAWIADAGGILRYCNREYCRMFGRSASELVGRPLSAIAPPELSRQWIENNRLVLETRRPLQTVELGDLPEGKRGEFIVYKFLLEEGGNPLIGGTAVDVTERREVQARLERLNRLYAVSSAIHEAIFRTREIPSLHQTACRIAVERGGLRMAWIALIGEEGDETDLPLTCSARWGQGLEFIDTVLADSPRLIQAEGPCGRALRLGKPAVSNGIASDPGFVFHQAAAAGGFQSGGAFPMLRRGRIEGALIVYADQPGFFQEEEIQVLQHLADNLAYAAEHLEIEALERTARQLVRIQAESLNQAQEAIRITDLEGQLVHWNAAAEVLFGLRLDEARGARITQLLPEHQTVLTQAREATQAHGQWTGELTLRAADGSPRILESRWTLLRGDHDEPNGFLVIDNDITEKKKLETQFLRAQRLESIGILAGGIAHDLNNILAPILLSIQMLRESMADPGQVRLIDTLHQSAVRGAELVRQILTYSRGLETTRRPVPPRDLLHELQLLIRDTFPKNIATTFECAPGTAPVKGDPTQLSQMLLNLCVNARDAMPEGGLLVVRASTRTPSPEELARHPGAGDGPHTVFEVADTGCGIPLEVQPRIFEHFFTTKEPGKGTGLGLPTTMAIVTSHQGFIDLDSAPGHGTTFRVLLPATPEDAPKPASPLTHLAPHRGQGETILVVDDESSLRSITRQVLQACGYQVVEAASGEAALRAYHEQGPRIDLVLTDMMMPGMSGAELVRALHRLKPGLPVVVVSGISNAAPEEFHGLDVRHFLGKPYTSEELLQALRAALAPPS